MGYFRSFRPLCRGLALAVLCLLAACASQDGTRLAQTSLQGTTGAQPAAPLLQQALPGLSGLPAGLGLALRSTSAVQYELLDKAPVRSSPGASYAPGSLDLDPAQNSGLAWAIFELFDFPGNDSIQASSVSFEGSGSFYASVSNYDELRWQHLLIEANDTITLGEGGIFYSSDGSLYVAVIATGETVSLQSIQVETDAALPNVGWDEREDNDAVTRAQVLPPLPLLDFKGSLGLGGYDGDTADYFRFEATEGQRVDLLLNYDLTSANFSLTLFKPGVSTVLIEDTEGNSGVRHLNIGLKAGSYAIRISALSGAGEYTLDASLTDEAYTELEDNDSSNGANALVDVLSVAGSVGEGSYDGDDADFFSFAVADGDVVTMTLSYASGNGNLSLTLLDNGGVQVHSDDQANPGLRSFSWGLKAGSAYARVAAQTGGSNYDLQIVIEHPGYSEVENNDTFNTAMALAGLPQTNFTGNCGEFGYDGDAADYFVFDCSDGDIITVSLDYDESIGNLSLSLYNSGGLLAHDDKGGNPGSRSFSWGVLGGSCGVAVKSQSGGSDYTLNISKSSPGYDETEHNDSQINADQLPAFPFSGFLGSLGVSGYDGDSTDYYTFTAQDQQLFSFSLAYDETSANLSVSLLNSSGAKLYEDNSGNPGLREFDWGLQAGSYFLKIAAVSGATDYTLAVSQLQQDLSESEDNDTRLEAQALPALPVSDFDGHVGAFGYDGDNNDYFFFNLDGAMSFSSTLSYDNANGSVSFYLLDSTGAVLASDTTLNPGTRTVADDIGPGTYYLRVQAFSGSADYSFDTN